MGALIDAVSVRTSRRLVVPAVGRLVAGTRELKRDRLWQKGDFTRIAASMRESGEELVGTLGISGGLDVLEVGSGDGTTAVPAAVSP